MNELRKYIQRKIEILNDDGLIENLENAIFHWARQTPGVLFGGFDEYSSVFVWIDGKHYGLPTDAEEIYAEETNKGRSARREEGLYVHIMNNDVDDLGAAIDAISKITGEICAADFGDSQFSTRGATVGVVLRGTPTASFGYDCWSYIGRSGKRYATKDEFDGNSARNEHWIVPDDCEIVGLVASDEWYDSAEKIVKKMSLSYLFSAESINNWTADTAA